MGETGGLCKQDASKHRDRLQFGWSYKRLDKGTFRIPAPLEKDALHVAIEERVLDDLLEGIELDVKPMKKRIH